MKSLLYFSFLLFFVTEFILNRMYRSTKTDQKGADKKSLIILWGTICLSFLAAGFISGYIELIIYRGRDIYYASLAALYTGMLIRLYAVYSLGKFFTVDVTIRNEHQLKTDGIFDLVRHPNYMALLISFFGIGLVYNNWLSLLLVVIPITAAFIYRIKIEEQVLIKYFGEEYLEYAKKTKRLIPFIY